MEKLILYALTALLLGCSTDFRKKTLTYMGGAFLAGATVGAVQSGERENKDMHALLWGSAASAVVGASLLYLYDESSELKDKDYQIRELTSRLNDAKGIEQIKANNGESSFFESKLPKEYSHLVEPGKWKIYQINEWKKVSESEYVHQDKLMEIEPAKIKIEK